MLRSSWRLFSLGGSRSCVQLGGCSVVSRSLYTSLPNSQKQERQTLLFNQVRQYRLNSLRYKLQPRLNTSSIEAVVEPTPPKLISIRNFFDAKQFLLHWYWNIRSWWTTLNPTMSVKSLKQMGGDYYLKFKKAEVSGDFQSVSSICNLTLFQEAKKKLNSQNRKDLKIIWNHSTPKCKLASMRLIQLAGKISVLQVGVWVSCKQGVTIKKKDKVVKEIPKKLVRELIVLEASILVARNESMKWKILDILDEKGYGMLPRTRRQRMMEEQ